MAFVVLLLAAACSSPVGLTPAQKAALPGDHISVIGDSYTVGPDDNPEDPDAWPATVFKRLRDEKYEIQDVVAGEGGSGYVQPGHRGGVFGDKVPSVQATSDLVVIFGGANDLGTDPERERKAVRDTFERVRRAAPKAHLLIVGPAWPRDDVPPEVFGVRDIVREEAARAGAKFVDPLAERWLWADANLIGPDWIHPNRAGQQYLAQKMLPLIQAELPPPRKAISPPA